MLVRKAKKDDMPGVFKLIQELAAFQEQASAIMITVADLIRDGFTDRQEFQCLVAEDYNEIIGIAFYSFGYSTWLGRTIKLDDLIVREDQRGKGIGFKLYDELVRIAKIENVRRITWFVYKWNKKAIEFYKKIGATAENDLLIMQVADPLA